MGRVLPLMHLYWKSQNRYWKKKRGKRKGVRARQMAFSCTCCADLFVEETPPLSNYLLLPIRRKVWLVVRNTHALLLRPHSLDNALISTAARGYSALQKLCWPATSPECKLNRPAGECCGVEHISCS